MNKWLKLFLLAVLCLGSAKITFAQGALYQDIAWRYTPAGAFPAGGATVTICTSGASGTPCSPTITIYSDSALSTVASNPLAACTTAGQVGCIDNLGNFSFYMTPGTFSYTITGAGLSAYGPIPGGTSCVVGISCVTPSGNIAFTGNNTHSGMETFANGATTGNWTNSGAWTFANINKTVYVDQQADATADVKFANACAALPSSGGILNATGFGAGTQSIALQFKTSNAADAASLINSSATVTPTIKFELMPSN